MLEIRRVGRLAPRYVVSDDRGHRGEWVRRRFKEAATGEIDGQPYEFGRGGRRRFVLMQAGVVLATADADRRGRWVISVGDSAYELRRKSAWRSEMELCAERIVVGSVRRTRRGEVLCALPAELSPAGQVFVGFVVMTLWGRAAATSAASAGAVAGSGS